MVWDALLLFGSAFLSATLLPFYSEVVLVAQLIKHPQAQIFLVLVASCGNTAGAALNWFMGRYLLHYQERRWFPIRAEQLHKAQDWFARFGQWSLLLSWLPVGGDALTLLAGVMRVPFGRFLVLTFIGKAGRYLVVALALAQIG